MPKKELVAFIALVLLFLATVSFVNAALPGIPEVGPGVCAWHQNNNPSSPRCDERTQRCAQGCPPISQSQATTSSGNTYSGSTNQQYNSGQQKIMELKRRVEKNIKQQYGQGSRRTTAFENCLNSKTNTKECNTAIKQCKDHIDSIQSGLAVFAKKCSETCRFNYNNCRFFCGSDKSCFKYSCQLPGSVCLTSCNAQLNGWWPNMETSTGRDAGDTQLNDRINDFKQKCEASNNQGTATPSKDSIQFSAEKNGALANNLLYNKLLKTLKEKGYFSAEELSTIETAIKTHKQAFRVNMQNLPQNQRFGIDLPNGLPLQNIVVTTARPINNAETTITLIDDAALHKALPLLRDVSVLGTPDYPIPEPSPQDYDVKQTFKVDTKITSTEMTAEDEAKYLARKEEWVDYAINRYYAEEAENRKREIERGTDEPIKEYYLREKNHVPVEPWLDYAIKKAYEPEILNRDLTQEQKEYRAQQISRGTDEPIKEYYLREKNHVPVEPWIDYAINQIYVGDSFYKKAEKMAYSQDEKSNIQKIESWVDVAIKRAYAQEGNKVNNEEMNAIQDYSRLRSEQKEIIIKDAIEKKSAHTSALIQSTNWIGSAQNDILDDKPFNNAWFSYTVKTISEDETKHAKLLRYDESKKAWTPLPTRFSRCELGLCHFVSESPGTSYFAIVIEKQTKSFLAILIRTIILSMLIFLTYCLKKKIKQEKKTEPPTITTRIKGAIWGTLLLITAVFMAFIAIMAIFAVNQTISYKDNNVTNTDFITAIFVSLATLDFFIYKRIKNSEKQIMLAYGARDWLKGAMTGLIFAVITHIYALFS